MIYSLANLLQERKMAPSELVGQIKQTLISRGQTLSTAESCTGGLVGGMLTEIEGSSSFYLGGVIAYANQVKIQTLDVPKSAIDEYGAVSQQVAEYMAKGVCRLTGSNLGIATTGIAGPGGGTPSKPVGTVWFAICRMGDESPYTFTKLFSGDRSTIRQAAVQALLEELQHYVSDHY